MCHVSRVRSLLLLLTVPILSVQVWLLVRPFLAGPTPQVEDALALLLAWVALIAWAWFAAALMLVAGEALVTARVRRHRDPSRRAARAVVGLLCGVGVGVGVTMAPAHADTIDLDGLAIPDRVAGQRPAQSPDAAPTVVVRAGDTLWHLAIDHDTTWPELYELNRDVIGSDPDLIHPGQRLLLPTPETQR